MIVYWDIETYSQISLPERGAYIYAADPSTGVFFLCYAIDDGEIQVWKPGDPIATPFADPAGYTFIADNFEFERCIHTHILIPRFGFAPIPIESQDCAQRLALASAFPAELGLRCEALGLPYRKDPEARKAMHRLSRPQTAKKRKKPEDPAARERDLALLLERCKGDVAATRAAYNSPRLRPLLPEERQQLLLDARINARGVCANTPFLEAARALAIQERNAVNTRLNELTAGVITTVDQVARTKDAINARGHAMTTLNKRSVAATLAHQPDDYVRELLELRQRGAYASVKMAKRLLAHADPGDARVRGALRIFGAGPGRWSSPGAQLHNLRRNDAEHPASLVSALIAGNHAELARFGSPLGVTAELSRAALCAKPGHVLICVDFGAIESRVLAWQSGERWKLDAYRQYDATGDKTLEPYRVIAARMLRKDIGAIASGERQMGKAAELAAGFGGSVGAWRRIAGDDGRADGEVLAIIRQWRDAHPAIRAFWRELAQAARVAIRTGRPILVAPPPRPPIIATFDDYALTLTLPSGRAINYPGAHLIPNRKFEDGDPDIEFFDNAQGQWKPTRAWFGTLVENVVQGTARDLLAAALLRFDARGLPIVFHCHDEVVIEVPEGSVSEQEVLAILLEPPTWANGLPLGGKVHSGPLYLEAPATGEPPAPKDEAVVERAIDTFVATAEQLSDTEEIEEDQIEVTAPLFDLVSVSLTADNKTTCPFHEPDDIPSLQFYPDHFHCFGCGEHGDRLDWLMRGEEMTHDEAIARINDWHGSVQRLVEDHPAIKLERALTLWDEAKSIHDTLADRYLATTRKIELTALPADLEHVLRFHPSCPFGPGLRHPCLLALMRNPTTDVPTGIQRIALARTAEKIDRRMLGQAGAVKLWATGNPQLVIGEGLETVLAAATRISYRGTLLQPAWSALSTGFLERLPVLPGVERLIILVDHDGPGKAAAATCANRWQRAGRTVIRLTPKNQGTDFNDVIMERAS
jgi:DNA polymerase